MRVQRSRVQGEQEHGSFEGLGVRTRDCTHFGDSLHRERSSCMLAMTIAPIAAALGCSE